MLLMPSKSSPAAPAILTVRIDGSPGISSLLGLLYDFVGERSEIRVRDAGSEPATPDILEAEQDFLAQGFDPFVLRS